MSNAEIERYLDLAAEDLAAAHDNLRLGHLIEPRFGRILHEAFEARLDSDYVPHPDLSENSARQLVAKAEDFVKRMLHFLKVSGKLGEGEDAAQ